MTNTQAHTRASLGLLRRNAAHRAPGDGLQLDGLQLGDGLPAKWIQRSWPGLSIGIVRSERILPPLLWGLNWIGIDNDAVHRANRGETLSAAGAQFGNDDHVYPVVEDRPKVRRAVPQTRVAVDARRHINLQRWVFPLGVSGSGLVTTASRCSARFHPARFHPASFHPACFRWIVGLASHARDRRRSSTAEHTRLPQLLGVALRSTPCLRNIFSSPMLGSRQPEPYEISISTTPRRRSRLPFPEALPSG
jgi:hypothetical protein